MTQRKATKRTASLDLEWHNPSEDTWQADLPAIPGYTDADGNDSFVTVTYDDDGSDTPWEAVATIFPSQGGVVNLDCWTMMGFDPMGESADDVMQAVDDMDVYDFSYALENKGIEPMVDEDGEYVVASRKATRRKADLGALDWEEYEGTYQAFIPPIYAVEVTYRPDGLYEGWSFEINDGRHIVDSSLEFGFDTYATAEEAMSAVENLTIEDIEDVFEIRWGEYN